MQTVAAVLTTKGDNGVNDGANSTEPLGYWDRIISCKLAFGVILQGVEAKLVRFIIKRSVCEYYQWAE